MDFGKLAHIDRVDFSFPKDRERSLAKLRAAPLTPRAARRLYVGAPLWSVKEWIGTVYPAKTPAKDFLHHYSRAFNSIELNSTFYRVPETKTIRAWADAVPSGFRFSPKLNQFISHQPNLAAAERAIQAFFDQMAGLGESLGMSFLQLPPSFGAEGFKTLERMLSAVPKRSGGLAVEFRHPIWFKDHCLRKEAWDLLESFEASTVITDVAGRRDVLHTALSTRRVMIRFVGNELHPSDYTRAEDWVERLKTWFEAGLEEAYFFVHHPGYENVPALSSFFTKKLNEACGFELDDCLVVGAAPQLSLLD